MLELEISAQITFISNGTTSIRILVIVEVSPPKNTIVDIYFFWENSVRVASTPTGGVIGPSRKSNGDPATRNDNGRGAENHIHRRKTKTIKR